MDIIKVCEQLSNAFGDTFSGFAEIHNVTTVEEAYQRWVRYLCRKYHGAEFEIPPIEVVL